MSPRISASKRPAIATKLSCAMSRRENEKRQPVIDACRWKNAPDGGLAARGGGHTHCATNASLRTLKLSEAAASVRQYPGCLQIGRPSLDTRTNEKARRNAAGYRHMDRNLDG